MDRRNYGCDDASFTGCRRPSLPHSKPVCLSSPGGRLYLDPRQLGPFVGAIKVVGLLLVQPVLRGDAVSGVGVAVLIMQECPRQAPTGLMPV